MTPIATAPAAAKPIPARSVSERLSPAVAGRLSPEAKGFALGASAAIIWGLYLALARQGVATGLTPVDIAAFRYVTAGLVMLPFLVIGWREVRAVGLWRSLVLAALAGPPFILFGVGGYLYAPLAHGAVIQPAVVTTLSMVLAAVFLGDRPGLARVLGVTIILLGIAVIAGPGLFMGGTTAPLGDSMFAVAGVLWALFTLLSRRWQVPPVTGTAVVSVLSGAVMLPVALLTQGASHYAALPAGTLLVQILVQGLLTGVVSVIAFTTASKLIGPARAAIFPALVPAAAIIIGIPVAGEWPTLLQIAGLALVSLGLLTAIGLLHLPILRPQR
jgi:drug/metabolite transporter (DMT)-like permease